MEKNKISVLTIAATYIGTVVGAGFATGQEVFQFFTLFGWWGVVGLILSTGLFIYFGYLIMDFSKKVEAESHLKVIEHVSGKYIGKVLDYIITFFLFGALVIMAAGAGALFKQQFGLSSIIGSGLIVTLTLITVLLGLNNVIKAISFVVPFLLIAVLGVSAMAIFNNPITPEKINFVTNAERLAAPNWGMGMILYVSYNLVLAVAILAPLGRRIDDKKSLMKGAILGGAGLGIGALAINLAMLANIPETANYEVPMVFLAGKVAPFVAIGYSIVLLMEVYTTAVGSLFGFVARLVRVEGKRRKIYAIVTSIVAFFASRFGFSNMIQVILPIVGYAGLLLLAGLIITNIRMHLESMGGRYAYAKPLNKDRDKK